MKEGYKKTSIGLIPKDWNVIKLGEIGKVIIGLTYSPDDIVKEGGTLVLRSSNIQGNSISYGDKVYVSKNIPSNLRTKQGDILICSRNGSKRLLGKSALIDSNSSNHTFGAFMSVYRTDFPKFIFYHLQSNLFRKQLDNNNGATINQITSGDLLSFKFPLPPLPEQRKIAEVLSTVDEKIEVIGEQIERTHELKKALMQRLLTKGIGHTRFKDSPLGQIPESWSIKPLEELVDRNRPIRYGIVQTGENVAGGVPCLRVADFSSRRFSVDDMIGTSQEISSKFLSTILQEGDIVFPLRGRIGEVKLVDSYLAGINLTRGVALISNSDKALPAYLLWQLQSPAVVREIMLKVNGTTLQEIPIGGLKSVSIPIAPKEEQVRISNILSTVNEKLDVLHDQKDQYHELKKGLMQQLLTGKIRLNHLIEQPELA